MMRPAQKRRLKLLALAIGCLALLAGGAYAARQWQLDSRAEAARADGRAAFERGDFSGALQGLGRYLDRFGDETDAADDWRTFAKARRRVELPNRKHLGGAIAALRKCLEQRPDLDAARRDLLAAYIEAGWGTEALETAELLLRTHPEEAHLLRTKAELLLALRRVEEALAASREHNAVAPDDVEGLFFTLRLLSETHTAPDEIRKWMDQASAARPDDRALLVLRSAGYESVGDHEQARASLERALEGAVTDAALAKLLVRQLTAMRRFDDVISILAAMPADRVTPELRHELAARLWYAGRFSDLIDGVAAEHVLEDVETTAFQVLALAAAGRADEGRALATRLLADPAAPRDAAWCEFVLHTLARPSAPPANTVRVCKRALARDPSIAVVRAALASAYAELGETELAVAEWSVAATAAPSWPEPLIRVARSYLAKGRADLARAAAEAACQRAPRNVAAVATLAQALDAQRDTLDAASMQLLDTLATAVQAQFPGEEDTLPVFVRTRSRRDRGVAEAAVRAVLDESRRPSERVLFELAEACRDCDLDLSDRCLARAEELYGVTAPLALARAVALRAAGKAGDALEYFESAAAAADAASPEWRVAHARFLELSRDPRATATWHAAAAAFPADTSAQLATLGSRAAWVDRDAIAEVITRIGTLLPEDGLTARLAQAQWTVADPTCSDAELAKSAAGLGELARLAPGAVAVRATLAKTLERLGNVDASIEQLRIATNLAPGASSLQLELARLLQRSGDFEGARASLDAALRTDPVEPDDVIRAVTMLDRQGDSGRALQLLDRVAGRRQLADRELLALARVELRRGRIDRVIGHCERLATLNDSDAIAFAAAVYASVGRVADADATIARVEGSSAPPAWRALARAEYYAGLGDHERARNAFRSASAAAPNDGQVWTRYLVHCIRVGDGAELAHALDVAPANGTPIPTVDVFRRHRALVSTATADPSLRELAASLASNPTEETCLTEALSRLSALSPRARLGGEVLGAMQSLADRNPRVLALQLVVTDLLVRSGRVDEGVALVQRAVRLHPDQVYPLRVATESLLRAGRWADALQFGTRWRERSDVPELACSIARAEALTQLGRPTEALAELESYARFATEKPGADERAILVYAHALIAAGRSDDAILLLRPLCAKSDRWVELGLQIGRRQADAGAAREWLRMLAPDCAQVKGGTLALARAWGALWERTRDPADHAVAASLIEPLARGPERTAGAAFLAGALEEESGRLERAEEFYRTAIEVDGALSMAHNNLAMVLTKRGRAESAMQHALEALRLEPENVEYLDTKATVQLKLGQAEAAAATLRAAGQIDPSNARWTVALAEVLRDGGRMDELQRMRPQLQALIARRGTLAPALADRVSALGASVGW